MALDVYSGLRRHNLVIFIALGKAKVTPPARKADLPLRDDGCYLQLVRPASLQFLASTVSLICCGTQPWETPFQTNRRDTAAILLFLIRSVNQDVLVVKVNCDKGVLLILLGVKDGCVLQGRPRFCLQVPAKLKGLTSRPHSFWMRKNLSSPCAWSLCEDPFRKSGRYTGGRLWRAAPGFTWNADLSWSIFSMI